MGLQQNHVSQFAVREVTQNGSDQWKRPVRYTEMVSTNEIVRWIILVENHVNRLYIDFLRMLSHGMHV